MSGIIIIPGQRAFGGFRDLPHRPLPDRRRHRVEGGDEKETKMKFWPRTLTIPRAPDFVIGEPGDLYLRRWWVIPRNKWFNIYLHHFIRSDDDRALHDHPWVNLSILLRGSYREHMPGDIVKLRKPWRPWAFWRMPMRKATALHAVELIGGKQVWTLFITGPKIREWGFACPNGWRHWEEFVSITPRGNQRGRGCD
jgi:hypothetical protein